MPTVLIADDNSNIQKMVVLAFKDEGIDVVTVGNGEAAVKKAAEIMPDLVLADIFMPVRSGYEVCEYLKKNTRFAHIPIVLLAGAFDPFDEREAQRVGADGVLKKPFVPTDPLVNLVKSLLAKSNAAQLVPVSAATQSSPVAELKPVASFPVAASHVEEAAPSPAPQEFSTDPDEAPSVKDFSLSPSQFGLGTEGGADAFGAMLSIHEESEPEPIFKPSFEENHLHQEPTPAIDSIPSWMGKSSTLEEQPSEPAGFESPVEAPKANSHEKKLDGRGWNIESAAAEFKEDTEETIVDSLERYFPVNSSKAVQPEIESDSQPPAATPIPPVTAFATDFSEGESEGPVVRGSATEELDSPGDLLPPAKEWQGSFAPSQGAEYSEPSQDDLDSWRKFTPADSVIADKPEDSSDSASAIDSSDHEGTVAREAEPVAETTPDPGVDVHAAENFSSLPVAGDTEMAQPLTASNETIETAMPSGGNSITQADSFPVPAPSPMDPKVVEDMVTRVVERMQPQILEVITREVLRPLVEALVRRQLEQK